LYNNKTFISTKTKLFVTTISLCLLFFVPTISNQIFAQEGFTLEDLELSNKTESNNNTSNESLMIEQQQQQSINQGQQRVDQLNATENSLSDIGKVIEELFMDDKDLIKQEESVNETIALENEIINETVIGQQEKQEQTRGSTLEEQLKLAQEKLNLLGLGSFSDNGSKLKIDIGFPPIDFSKMFKDARSLIEVEYQSAQSVVLRGDEETLLLLNGSLAPFWYAIDIVKKHGYQLKEITESGMGSQGNPTRLYAILEKEKNEEKIQSLDKQTQSAQKKIKNQTHQEENIGNWIKDESDNLSFMYPNHWNVNISDSRFDNYELLFREKASNASIQVLDEGIKPEDKRHIERGPERYVEMYMRYNLPLSSDADKIATYPKGKVTIAGLPAYSELYLDQGNAILISLAFPEGNERHYTVVSRSPSSQYDNLESIILEIIKSITPKTIQKPLDQEVEIPLNNTNLGSNQDA
jgi:hypothetical protein